MTEAQKTATGHEFDVVFEDFALEPAAAVAPAGEVTFVVMNAGEHRHVFVLVRAEEGRAAPARHGHLVDGGAEIVGDVGPVAPHESRNASFTLTPGRYLMSCRERGHAQLGGGLELTVQPE